MSYSLKPAAYVSLNIPEEKRSIGADFARAYAILAVIAIHAACLYLGPYSHVPALNWWAATIYNTISRPAVPLFVMTSGMFLLAKQEESLKIFFQKRLNKILIPFLFWQAFYYLCAHSPLQNPLQPLHFLEAIIDQPACYHLWFLFMLVGLYLATPVLRVYLRTAKRSDIQYFLLVWFCFESLLPLLREFTHLKVIIFSVVMTGYVGYFLLGFYLKDVKIEASRRPWLIVGALAAFILTSLLTFILGSHGHRDEDYFSENMSALTILSTTCLFLYFQSLDYQAIFAKFAWLKSIIKVMQGTSFGVYLVHAQILTLMENWLPAYNFPGAFITIPMYVVLVYLMSLLIVELMQRLPFLKKTVPT